jgi:glycosyltransferase involved in cell wall biosynthesis
MLSIITVVYNDNKGLSDTINSLIVQKNKNFEHVIIDGGSDDGTLEVITKKASNMGFFISEPDNGIYDAMNKGIENASGNFISFLNAGDTAFPNYTETCIDFFVKNTTLDYCYANIVLTSKRGKKIYQPKGVGLDKDFLQKMPFPHPGLFVRKEVFYRVGEFNVGKKITADHEWIVRMITCGIKGKKVNKDQPVVDFKLDGVSLSFGSVIEMRDTAIQFGRAKVLANWRMIRGFLVVVFYKYFK